MPGNCSLGFLKSQAMYLLMSAPSYSLSLKLLQGLSGEAFTKLDDVDPESLRCEDGVEKFKVKITSKKPMNLSKILEQLRLLLRKRYDLMKKDSEETMSGKSFNGTFKKFLTYGFQNHPILRALQCAPKFEEF